MKPINLLVSLFAITCLLSCGKGGTSPSSTNNNNSNNNTSSTVSTIAGGSTDLNYPDGTGSSASFYSPAGITIDPSGNLYVTDQNRIRKVTQAGVVTTFAGSTTATSHGYMDGTGTNALFNNVKGITSDAAGNLYVCDGNNYRIRKITPAGVVSTIAGNGTSAQLDGTGTNAEFISPTAITIDASSNLYVMDGGSLRKITSSGVVSTIGNNLGFSGIITDASGSNIYGSVGLAILKITLPANVQSTFAGNPLYPIPGFSDGTGTNAKFYSAQGMAFDAAGNLYVCDQGNYKIRKITPVGVVTTFAGTTTSAFTDGPIASAQFQSPVAMAIDASDNMFICDGRRIRKITKQ